MVGMHVTMPQGSCGFNNVLRFVTSCMSSPSGMCAPTNPLVKKPCTYTVYAEKTRA